jgi:predicted porin
LSSFDNTDLDLHDNSSRVGIKGDVDLGLEDTKGVFKWEFNIATTDAAAYGSGTTSCTDGVSDTCTDVTYASSTAGNLGPRLAYIGATGSWGTALVGRQYHPHFLLMNLNTYTFSDASMAERYFLGNDNHKRVDNTLAYVTPAMGGVTLVAGLVIAGDGNDSNGSADSNVDGYNVAAKYAGNGLNAAVSYGSVNYDVAGGTEDDEVWGFSAKYAVNDAATIMVRYEDSDEAAAGADSDVTFVGGTYKIDNTTLKLAYTDLDSETAGSDEDSIMLEVNQKMGKGSVYAAYMDVDADTAANDTDMFTVGYRLDF